MGRRSVVRLRWNAPVCSGQTGDRPTARTLRTRTDREARSSRIRTETEGSATWKAGAGEQVSKRSLTLGFWSEWSRRHDDYRDVGGGGCPPGRWDDSKV